MSAPIAGNLANGSSESDMVQILSRLVGNPWRKGLLVWAVWPKGHAIYPFGKLVDNSARVSPY